MGFIQDFKEFAFKGNLVDMAVGIVIGTAAGAIVKSFIEFIVAPLIGALLKVPDLSALKIPLGGSYTNAEGQVIEGAVYYGSFIQSLLDFLILAFAVFVAVRVMNKFTKKTEAAAPPKPEVQLLTEIRDALVRK